MIDQLYSIKSGFTELLRLVYITKQISLKFGGNVPKPDRIKPYTTITPLHGCNLTIHLAQKRKLSNCLTCHRRNTEL